MTPRDRNAWLFCLLSAGAAFALALSVDNTCIKVGYDVEAATSRRDLLFERRRLLAMERERLRDARRIRELASARSFAPAPPSRRFRIVERAYRMDGGVGR